MSKPLAIADLRASMGISLAQMAETLGLTSRGHLSDIERGKTPPSLSVALAIESLSDGRIDAAALNADVAAARAGFVRAGAEAGPGAGFVRAGGDHDRDPVPPANRAQPAIGVPDRDVPYRDASIPAPAAHCP